MCCVCAGEKIIKSGHRGGFKATQCNAAQGKPPLWHKGNVHVGMSDPYRRMNPSIETCTADAWQLRDMATKGAHSAAGMAAVVQ